MAELPVVVLPPLIGGQAESWAALVELAPVFGDNWLLVGGQMVFLDEVERQATDVRPTDDVDAVVEIFGPSLQVSLGFTRPWVTQGSIRMLPARKAPRIAIGGVQPSSMSWHPTT